MKLELVRNTIRSIQDFPIPGVVYKDITPVIGDVDVFAAAIDLMCEPWLANPPDRLAAIDARGFFFGGAMSLRLGAGIVPIRKAGKLPFHTLTQRYELEYGEAEIQVHTDAIRPGERVLIVDDVLATGGTAAAAAELVRRLGGEVIGMQFLLELSFLGGAAKLGDTPFFSLIRE